MSRKRSSHATPRVSRVESIVFAIAAVISVIGLADATYLTVQAVTGQSVICGGSASCSEVLGSAYASLGGVPVAVFGVVAYFSAFAFATFAAFGSGRARRLFAMIVWLMFAGTLWFLYVQAFVLHAYCRYCLFSAAMTFLLAGLVIASPPVSSKSLS
ncbi:MAG: vitamin K epoxide reductase family protein [Verrucomicrobiota bacterium]|nr:vitamin K epoxide reductase family protein [Verrucomicrobiota bacterium]